MFELIRNDYKSNPIDSLLNNFLDDIFIDCNAINNIDSYFSDDENNYYIDIALPGLEKKDINLDVSNNFIILSCESKSLKDNSFWSKSFNRKIELPNNIKLDSISAKLKNGILSIIIKKETKGNESMKINIK